MKYAIAKVSTKGQIVIPSPMRDKVKTGDEFLIVQQQDSIIMKRMDTIALKLKEDLRFAERVEHAWKEHDAGKFERKSKDEFLKILRSC